MFEKLLMMRYGITVEELWSRSESGHFSDLYKIEDAIYAKWTAIMIESQLPVNWSTHEGKLISFMPKIETVSIIVPGEPLIILEQRICPVPGCIMGDIGPSELPWVDAKNRARAIFKARKIEKRARLGNRIIG